MRAFSAALATLVAVASGPASGAEPSGERRAAIVPLEVEGDMIEADREVLSRELVAGLERGAFAIVSPQEIEEQASASPDCRNARCWQAFARAHTVTHIVQAKITVIERDYDIEVVLLDGRSGQPVARSQQSCEICGIADAGALLQTAAATLRTKLDALTQSPASLSIASSPGGAMVTVDGEVVGTTPLERQVLTGKHVLRVSKDGYITVEREVTFVEGIAETLRFDLEKVPSRLPPRPWGWVTLGTGIASIGAAIAFAVLRDRPFTLGGACSGDNIDADGDCRRVWNTEWHVLGFGLAGAALTTLGAAILVSSRGVPRRRSARFHIEPRGVGLIGRF